VRVNVPNVKEILEEVVHLARLGMPLLRPNQEKLRHNQAVVHVQICESAETSSRRIEEEALDILQIPLLLHTFYKKKRKKVR